MSTQVLFPTLVYQARLPLRGWRRLNARLLRECRQLRADDAAGRRWSARNYPGGYSSYNSAHRMQRLSPTFASLARELDRHVARFARRLQLQERLTQEVATTIQEVVEPRGVGVICEARHFCMMMRGVEKQHSGTVTSAMLGAFREGKETRDEFLSLVSHKNHPFY